MADVLRRFSTNVFHDQRRARCLAVRRPAVRRFAVFAVVVSLLLAACESGGGGGSDAASPSTSTTSARERSEGSNKSDRKERRRQRSNSADEEAGAATGKTCPEPDLNGVEALSAQTEVVSAGSDGEPRVEAVVYPRPRYEGQPWTQWGQGVVLDDGTFVSAIGDHCGVNGNSYFYAFDPSSSTLRLLGDVLSTVGHESGAWGYGKVHGQLVPGPDGGVYAATYWGTRKSLAFDAGYQGDVLLRLDPASGDITDLGTAVPRHGVPSLAGWPAGGMLYGEAVDPAFAENQGSFFAYDIAQERVVFEYDGADHDGFRNVMVGPDGTAYFSAGEGRLQAFDPRSGELSMLDGVMPGATLRASTRPAPDGTVYGITKDPEVLFALRPGGRIEALGPVRGYTASVAMDPSGERVYYVPDAHGGSWEQNTPVISVDTRTGEEEVLVELNPMAEESLGLRVGGTYDIAVDPSGDRLFVGLNAGPADSDDDPFGEVVLMVVDLR